MEKVSVLLTASCPLWPECEFTPRYEIRTKNFLSKLRPPIGLSSPTVCAGTAVARHREVNWLKILLLALALSFIMRSPRPLLGQVGSTTGQRTFRIETRQGTYLGGSDVMGHGSVSKADSLKCMLVEVVDETHTSSTSCVLRFAKHGNYTLAGGQSLQSPVQGELHLECSGDKPRRCIVQVN
jgi:hypothetical protein